MESEETSFLPPGIPQFNYQNPPKLPFPLLVKKSQRQKYEGQANEDDGMSSSSDGSVFMFHETTLKVPSFRGKDIDKGKYDGRFVCFPQFQITLKILPCKYETKQCWYNSYSNNQLYQKLQLKTESCGLREVEILKI